MVIIKILLACEESQTLTIKLREIGHEAYSCDLVDCSGEHNEWHIKDDVLPLLNGNCTFKTLDGIEHTIIGKWDAILAFPPCTHLAVSGATHFEKKRLDGRQREGIELFMKIFNADCDKVVVENPIGIISGDYIPKHFPDLAELYKLPIKPTQIIHPWMFGDGVPKSTCLWIKGLDKLVPQITEQPEMEYFEWKDRKTGKLKRQAKWFYEALRLSPSERARVRSKTFDGVANAMVEQWFSK